jgi:hypothetical protein
MVFPTCQMIFDVIGDLLADRRQLKQLVVDERIVARQISYKWLLGPVDSQANHARRTQYR